jgi:hypothetical protein
MTDQAMDAELRRKNLRTGILLGLFALVCFVGFLVKMALQ